MLIRIAIVLLAHIAVPVYLLYTLWRLKASYKAKWLLRAVVTGSYLAAFFVIGRWDWVSIYLRYLFAALYPIAAYVSYRRVAKQPWLARSEVRSLLQYAGAAFELLFGIALLGFALSGYTYASEPVRIASPLQNGVYYIGHGGSNFLINYHNVNQAQQYALDILALNAAGTRAVGIYPNKLMRYKIYGEPVHSPCAGRVTEAVDGLQDNIPPNRNHEHLAGNHVAIECKGVIILLAHMKRGSLQVQSDQNVTAGQVVGQVGNSGNTTEPHLHIHAVRAGTGGPLEGVGVPLVVDGNFPVRNNLLIN